jgi:5-formyltetrahydrofolate cyclo-ligase
MNKKEFRRSCIDRLKKINRGVRYGSDKRLSKILYRYIKDQNYRVIMLYVPLKIEINIFDLIQKLRRENRVVLVPFMEGKSFRLVKYRLPINIKKFGVKEPNISNNIYKKIDLAIVPVIGIDKSLRRVGFGQGFYDRFFEEHGKKIEKIFFVGRDYCLSSQPITDDYDVAGDLYITPKKIYKRENIGLLQRRNYDRRDIIINDYRYIRSRC